MEADHALVPDWRDAAAYAPLLAADRALFAWEWLRRDPAYRDAALRAARMPEAFERTAAAGEFGLVAFEPPHLGVPDARPVWRRDIHPYVLEVRATTVAGTDDAFDPVRLGGIARILAEGRAEHLLLSDGVRAIRLDGPSGAFTSGSVCLAYAIGGLASAEAPLMTLRRLLALCRTGRFSRLLHRPEAPAARWVLMLRAWDALVAGSGQREIADVLFSRTVGEPRWRSREPSVRSRAQRLVRSATGAARGGWRALLR